MDLRVIFDGALDGAWNMALDEALLESAARGQSTLRFYRWSQPTLSLGYFQSLRDRCSHAASSTAPVVRRSTGGGAIVHDRELTYSLSVPAKELRSAAKTRELYDTMHGTAVTLLLRMGVPAQVHALPALKTVKVEPFLCFQRRAEGDVVAGGQKLLGSAQRRARGGLLQHGSFLLGTSASAPEIVGLETWLLDVPDAEELARQWAQDVGTRLAVTLVEHEITDTERQRAELIQAAKFTNPAWTERR